jgi:hypothetical protein
VVRRLAEAGNEVAVFHRGRKAGDLPDGVRRITGDRKALRGSAGELRRFAPEVVLDMIPMNEGEARELVDVFRGVSRRVVAVSSQDVYRAYDRVTRRDPGPPDPVPLTEDSPLREKLYPYEREGVEDYEKVLVERVIMGLPTCPAPLCGCRPSTPRRLPPPALRLRQADGRLAARRPAR